MLDDLELRLRKKCLSTLCRICGRQGLLPRSLQIPVCYDRSEDALYSGGYADVWMGEYQGREVAVKVLRVYSTSDLDKIVTVGRRLKLAKCGYQRSDRDCADVLQGSCNVGEPPASKRAAVIGGDNEQKALCDGIRMDG